MFNVSNGQHDTQHVLASTSTRNGTELEIWHEKPWKFREMEDSSDAATQPRRYVTYNVTMVFDNKADGVGLT